MHAIQNIFVWEFKNSLKSNEKFNNNKNNQKGEREGVRERTVLGETQKVARQL